MLRNTTLPLLILVLIGTAVAGEMIGLECPDCGLTSGDLLVGTGKCMDHSRAIYWDPVADQFVSMTFFTGAFFFEEYDIEVDPSFYMGGTYAWELWVDYLSFFSSISWPDTISFPEDIGCFHPDRLDCVMDGIFLKMTEPYACPRCGAEMLMHRRGAWD